MNHTACRVPSCPAPLHDLRFCESHRAAWKKSEEGRRAYAFNVFSDFAVEMFERFVKRMALPSFPERSLNVL